MYGISFDTVKEQNLIYFPHPKNPTSLFFMESGKDLLFQNSSFSEPCRVHCEAYSGDYMHFKFGSSCYHVQQFAELAEGNGHKYEPADPIIGFELFEKKYLDRSLTDEYGKLIPYRMIWFNNNVFHGGETWFSRQMSVEQRRAVCICPEAALDRQACVIDGQFNTTFMSLSDLRDLVCSGEMKYSFGMQEFEKRQVLSSSLQARVRTGKIVKSTEMLAWKKHCPRDMTIQEYFGFEISRKSRSKPLDTVLKEAAERTADEQSSNSRAMSGPENIR